MSRIEADVFGDRALLDRLRLMRTQAQAPRAALHGVADDFLRLMATRFSGTAHWKPLTVGAAQQKAKKGRPTIPLAGGELERSLTVRGSRGSVRRVNKNGMLVGTRNPVARLHQGGTKERRPGGRLPARPIIEIGQADRDRWSELFSEHLMSRDRAFGRGL